MRVANKWLGNLNKWFFSLATAFYYFGY